MVLTYIEWVDSHSEGGGKTWNRFDDVEDHTSLLHVRTVGFVIKETDDCITVAASRYNEAKNEQALAEYVSGDICIPKCCITYREDLVWSRIPIENLHNTADSSMNDVAAGKVNVDMSPSGSMPCVTINMAAQGADSFKRSASQVKKAIQGAAKSLGVADPIKEDLQQSRTLRVGDSCTHKDIGGGHEPLVIHEIVNTPGGNGLFIVVDTCGQKTVTDQSGLVPLPKAATAKSIYASFDPPVLGDRYRFAAKKYKCTAWRKVEQHILSDDASFTMDVQLSDDRGEDFWVSRDAIKECRQLGEMD